MGPRTCDLPHGGSQFQSDRLGIMITVLSPLQGTRALGDLRVLCFIAEGPTEMDGGETVIGKYTSRMELCFSTIRDVECCWNMIFKRNKRSVFHVKVSGAFLAS